MKFQKITHGFVIQNFDDEGNCTGQEFIAGDQVEYEDEQGEPIHCPEYNYQPFHMVQPN